jgi:hypothetical protein
MNRRTFCAILPIAGALRPAEAASKEQPLRERLLFDHDWKFLLGDPTGAESPSYDAAGWRTLDVPHDWSIEGRIDPKNPMGGSGGSPAFLDACDRLGMLVMDEAFDCWSRGKNQFDYSVAFKDWWQRDIDAMVLRDRNHPSVRARLLPR